MRRWVLGAALVAFMALAPAAVPAQDYKTAPPEEQLAARAEEYVLRKRVVALVLIGGTLAGGILGMVSRRRARARARTVSGDEPPREDDAR